MSGATRRRVLSIPARRAEWREGRRAQRPRRALGALALFAGAAAALGACGESSSSSGAAVPDTRPVPSAVRDLPNIVFIYTDDQDLASFRRAAMPRTLRLFRRQGTILDQFVVSSALCCPSRVTALTGRYPHNSGVFSNKPGYPKLRDKRATLAWWLAAAGYRTAWVGKFLQNYDRFADDPAQPAPGYDEWHSLLTSDYYDYRLGVNGEVRRFGDDPDDYLTSVLNRTAVELIDRYAPRQRPLFLVLNHLASHNGGGDTGECRRSAAPAPADEGRLAHLGAPRSPSFNERDVSDKPRSLRGERLSRRRLGYLDRRYRCKLASLLEVDRGIAQVERALRRAGEWGNTVVLFTSDNGLLFGQHRLRGKNIPYEEGIHMPMAIRVPRRLLGGRRPPAHIHRLTANVDIAPTLLELAGGAKPCRAQQGSCLAFDGRSWVPLLRGRPGAWARGREILIESGKGGGECNYRGVRTARYVLVEHTGARRSKRAKCEPASELELYDLRSDPHQLRNRASDSSFRSIRRRLTAKLADLRGCSGRDC